MAIDKNARYLESHEYAKPSGEYMVFGFSDHAQAELGDVVFVELPAVGKTLAKGRYSAPSSRSSPRATSMRRSPARWSRSMRR